jgi:SAM-dependent methyltransferase
MRRDLLPLLCCPATGSALTLHDARMVGESVETGVLRNEPGSREYPIRHFIPRFVAGANYADSFGLQWNRFSRTQLDSHSGHPISADRFWKATGWTPDALNGQWVLDLGCGAGRFAEIALGAGAKVIAVDYSSAADACYANLKQHENLHVLQGNVYDLPFPPRTFPFIYSLGVLQHTPDVRRAFDCLHPLLVPGGTGRICVDFYEHSWKSALLPRHWLRPLTTRMDQETLFTVVEKAVPSLLSLSNAIGAIPGAGPVLRRLVPVANHRGILPLDDRGHREWALLDTFDWLSPRYDQPQTAATIRSWMSAAGLEEIEVLRAGHLVGRARSPRAPSRSGPA